MMDALNLDCMDEGELNTFWLANSESESTHNRQRARYAWHKRRAMQFRLQARINEAMHEERICGCIYDQLPQAVQW